MEMCICFRMEKKKRTCFWMAKIMPAIIPPCVVGVLSRIRKSSFELEYLLSFLPQPCGLMQAHTLQSGLQFLCPEFLKVPNFSCPTSNTESGTEQLLTKCGSWNESTNLLTHARIKHSGRWSWHHHLHCQARRQRLIELRFIQGCRVTDRARTWIHISWS